MFINTICSTGEPLCKNLALKLLLKCNSLYNLYGPTETTIWSTIKKVSAEDEIITIGQPISNTQVYILNKQLQPLSEGSIGEIYIAGDGVARGYWNRQALTGEKFVINPFFNCGSSKMYRTGDLGKMLSNGEIQCLGRMTVR